MYAIVKSGFRWASQFQTHRTGTLNSQDKKKNTRSKNNYMFDQNKHKKLDLVI